MRGVVPEPVGLAHQVEKKLSVLMAQNLRSINLCTIIGKRVGSVVALFHIIDIKNIVTSSLSYVCTYVCIVHNYRPYP